jgi:hypothetical protein
MTPILYHITLAAGVSAAMWGLLANPAHLFLAAAAFIAAHVITKCTGYPQWL